MHRSERNFRVQERGFRENRSEQDGADWDKPKTVFPHSQSAPTGQSNPEWIPALSRQGLNLPLENVYHQSVEDHRPTKYTGSRGMGRLSSRGMFSRMVMDGQSHGNHAASSDLRATSSRGYEADTLKGHRRGQSQADFEDLMEYPSNVQGRNYGFNDRRQMIDRRYSDEPYSRSLDSSVHAYNQHLSNDENDEEEPFNYSGPDTESGQGLSVTTRSVRNLTRDGHMMTEHTNRQPSRPGGGSISGHAVANRHKLKSWGHHNTLVTDIQHIPAQSRNHHPNKNNNSSILPLPYTQADPDLHAGQSQLGASSSRIAPVPVPTSPRKNAVQHTNKDSIQHTLKAPNLLYVSGERVKPVLEYPGFREVLSRLLLQDTAWQQLVRIGLLLAWTLLSERKSDSQRLELPPSAPITAVMWISNWLTVCQNVDRSTTVTVKEFYPPQRTSHTIPDQWRTLRRGGPNEVFGILAGLRSCYFRDDSQGGLNMTAAEWVSWVRDVHWGFTRVLQILEAPPAPSDGDPALTLQHHANLQEVVGIPAQPLLAHQISQAVSGIPQPLLTPQNSPVVSAIAQPLLTPQDSQVVGATTQPLLTPQNPQIIGAIAQPLLTPQNPQVVSAIMPPLNSQLANRKRAYSNDDETTEEEPKRARVDTETLDSA